MHLTLSIKVLLVALPIIFLVSLLNNQKDSLFHDGFVGVYRSNVNLITHPRLYNNFIMSFMNVNFDQADKIPDSLTWKVGDVPRSVALKSNGLAVVPNYETDFWQNTYYDPVLQSYNGHVLGFDTTEQMFVAATHFSFDAKVKFDQAGIFVGQDSANWLKAGVELSEGQVWQSVVVTRDDYSDWSKSYIPWESGKDVYIKVYREKESYVVETSSDGVHYDFVRIGHIATKGSVTAGMMVCRPPKDEGVADADEPSVRFHSYGFADNPGYEHTNQ